MNKAKKENICIGSQLHRHSNPAALIDFIAILKRGIHVHDVIPFCKSCNLNKISFCLIFFFNLLLALEPVINSLTQGNFQLITETTQFTSINTSTTVI